VNITLDNLGDLPARCRSCVFWELDPVAGEKAVETGGAELEKEAWISDTLLEWGSCGKLLYVDDVPAGYALFAPPAYVPRAVAFATSPVSPDAVLLMTARLVPEFAGHGLGRVLVQAVVGDVAYRGLKAIEAFGTHAAPPAERVRPPARSAPTAGPGALTNCVLPADYLLAVGFKTVRPHPHFPRLRLDVKAAVSWREDVEYALERLVSSIAPPALAPV
jgi:GNAT superfamily N-acetyltransferase